VRIALIGATGFAGSALLKEALDGGHEVAAIVRHPDKLAPRERLVAIGIDVNDTDRLAESIRGLEAPKSAEWNRGAYLARGLAHCGTCHTPRNLLVAVRRRRAQRRP